MVSFVEGHTTSPSTNRHDQEVNSELKKTGKLYSFPGSSRDFDTTGILADLVTRSKIYELAKPIHEIWMPLRQSEWARRMINSARMESLEPPCPGATRRGVASTPIRRVSSQCRGFGAAAPIRLYDGNQIYPLKTAKSLMDCIENEKKIEASNQLALVQKLRVHLC